MQGYCELFVAQAFDFAQGEDKPVVRRKLGQSALDKLGLGHDRGWITRGSTCLEVRLAGRFEQGFPRFGALAPALAQEIQALVGGDAIEPGAEGRLSAEGAEPLVRFKEDLLRGILSQGRIVQEGGAQAQDAGVMRADKTRKGLAVAGKNAMNQQDVVNGKAPLLSLRRFNRARSVSTFLTLRS